MSAATQTDLQRWLATWRYRDSQIVQLSNLLAYSRIPDVLVHGPTGTGKSSVVRDVLAGQRHAYVKCCKQSKLRGMLASIVSQLSGAKRKRSNAFAGGHASEANLCCELQEHCPKDQPSRVVVIDDAHLLLSASAAHVDGGPLLKALLQLRDHYGANLALVFISGSDSSTPLLQRLPLLQVVHFPQYTNNEVLNLLLKDKDDEQASDDAYRAFLRSAVLTDLPSMDRALPDLRALAASLWKKYLLYAQQAKLPLPLSEECIQRVHRRAQEGVRATLSSFEPGLCNGIRRAPGASRLYGGLELPLLAKFLVVAAYLASRNRASVDKQLFENSGMAGRRGGGRKKMSLDRQAEAAKEAQLKGPHNFPLQRLMTIYRMLRRSDTHTDLGLVPTLGGISARGGAGASSAAGVTGGAKGKQGGGGGSMMDVDSADVMMTVTSLVSARLLSQVSDDMLDAPRFQCDAPQEMVEQLAMEVGVGLNRYLKYV